MRKLSELPNIGPKVEAQLNAVGIYTPEDLRQVGSKEAWRRILLIDDSACIMRLNGIEGAIRGIRWHNLDQTTKDDLKIYYRQAKG